ncbi:hypothetical protein DFH08DRAFT_353254 [Mycena albidolilacea]|uniref:Secreted protein n=1 Tax=Mycena albidolilacea TaxID=1033008 RepID=A0AAD6ZI32_9AGAR|nr:hypothetical protein DFH08DRAFT_353254 [Mycena albidolilacea]
MLFLPSISMLLALLAPMQSAAAPLGLALDSIARYGPAGGSDTQSPRCLYPRQHDTASSAVSTPVASSTDGAAHTVTITVMASVFPTETAVPPSSA